MTNIIKQIATLVLLLLVSGITAKSQHRSADSSSPYQSVQTYVNPVLPGDHPDPTLLKVGNDFYHCGSTFHFNPYLPIYHSTDLIHWEVIARVLPAAKAAWVSDKPSAGIWQGAITYFYGSYWIYFSSGGQWFSKASSPKGPWSAPQQVKSNRETGNLGYDNSIFVDDDGTPYMVIKNGQKVNRLQELGKDGQLTGHVINLDWINAKLQYSWAEGPVMCKRNGFYYYFPAGDVSGGQYVLRGTALTSDSTKWERLGNFFKPITDKQVGFRRQNHIAAPFKLADGTWWTIGQSYEKYNGDDWSGTGRQTALYKVNWEGDRPWGDAPTTEPIIKPNLPKSSIPWRSVKTDHFDGDSLGLWWHFLTKKASSNYSLSARKGWVRLTPDTSRTHLVQKETDHYYTAVTKVDVVADATGVNAGIYITNGDQKVVARLYSGFDSGKKIILQFDTAKRTIPNTIGNVVWLKITRSAHYLTGYCSADGQKWSSLGAPVNVSNLDKVQPNYNSWVGTSIGLFAEGKPADFDLFICKDGATALPAFAHSNYYGVKTQAEENEKYVVNTSANGGWFMLSGVDMGAKAVSAIEVIAGAKTTGNLEIWLDDLNTGKLIATIPLAKTVDGSFKSLKKQIKNISGQHDVFVRFPLADAGSVSVKSLKFQ